MAPPEGQPFRQLEIPPPNGDRPIHRDFTCRAAMLVLEIDGDTHATQAAYDEHRTAFLKKQGWRIIRFTNADVMGNLEGVLQQLQSSLSPSPNPLP